MFFLFTLIVQFAGIFIIGQRSIILGLLPAVFIWGILNFKKLGLKPLIATFGLAILSGFLALKTTPVLKDKIVNLFNRHDVTGVDCRLTIWKLNLSKFLERPIIGNGEAIKYFCQDAILDHAHNIYIQKLVETGILGFIAAFAFILQIFFSIIRRPHRTAFVACFIALAIAGCFEDWLYHSSRLKAFLIMCILALPRFKTERI